MKNAAIIGITGMILLASTAMPAFAYIDPVTGSIVIQTIVGGLAAAAVAMRRVRKKIIGLFSAKPKDDASDA